jgi:hypothetical protein
LSGQQGRDRVEGFGTYRRVVGERLRELVDCFVVEYQRIDLAALGGDVEGRRHFGCFASVSPVCADGGVLADCGVAGFLEVELFAGRFPGVESPCERVESPVVLGFHHVGELGGDLFAFAPELVALGSGVIQFSILLFQMECLAAVGT